MEFSRSKEIDIINTISLIDHLLISLDIKPVLHYRSIEYRLKRNERKLMTIKLSRFSIVFTPLYDPEILEDQKCFEHIRASILTSLIHQ